MPTRMEIANSDFVAKLASYAGAKVIEPIEIHAAKNDTREKAVQCATAYFMMGWHWDEIASVLEDSGFLEHDVEQALVQAKKDVKAKLKEGPFSVLHNGQLVSLTTGGYGVLTDKRGDFISVLVSGEPVNIIAKQIDFEKTASLTQAFVIRSEAAEIMRRYAQTDEELGKSTTYRIKPDPQDTSGKGYNWPTGVPHQDPDTGEEIVVEDLDQLQQQVEHSLTVAVRGMMDLAREIEQENKVIEAETAELQEQLVAVRQSKAEHEAELSRLVEEVLNNVEQVYDVQQEEYTYVMNFLNRLVILHQHVAEPKERTELQYVSEYKKFYEGMLTWADAQPARIREKVLTAMEQVKAEVIQRPKPVWKRIFEVIWPTKEHRKMSQDMLSGVWKSIKTWVSNAFAAVQKYFDSWNNDIKPDLEEQIAQADAFIAQEEALDQVSQAQVAVAAVLKRCK